MLFTTFVDCQSWNFENNIENLLQVQKLKVTAAEAVKNKEDAELKCQHKIADMVALMEKHKVRSS